jgi:hypothetical protein
MDANFARESIDQELRRRQLAQRLVALQARTHTIFRLTGLSRHQLATMRRRWQVTTEMRRRGPLPKSFAAFLSTQRTRDEAAALAFLWRLFASVSVTSQSNRPTNRVETGECLCDVFDAHLASFPRATLELDHLVLLSRGVDEADVVALARCSSCDAVMLADLLGSRRRRCSHCQHAEAMPPLLNRMPATVETHELPVSLGEGVQQELF